MAYRSHKLTEVSFKLFFELRQLYRVSVICKTEKIMNIHSKKDLIYIYFIQTHNYQIKNMCKKKNANVALYNFKTCGDSDTCRLFD